MLITDIEKKGKNKYQIYLDGSPACMLSDESIVKSNLKPGTEIEYETLCEIEFENEKYLSFNLALKYLAIIKTEKQVKDYLYKKGFKTKAINETLNKLKSYKYIDDRAYAELFVKSYRLTKGKRVLQQELKIKGVDKEIIEEFTNEIENEQEAIAKIAEKYMKNKQYDRKTLSKLFSYLMNKGFDFEDINSIIRKKYMSDCEDET